MNHFSGDDWRRFDSIRQILEREEQQRRLLGVGRDGMSALRKQLSTHDKFFGQAESIAKLAKELSGGRHTAFSNSVRGVADSHARMLEAAVGPLSKLRAETLYEDQIARAAAALRSPFGIDASQWSATRDIVASLGLATSKTDTIANQVRQAINGQTLGHLAELARPFSGVSDHIQRELSRVKGLGEMFDPGEWARRLGMPLIDAASIATVAKAWGAEGAMRTLREIGGLDIETVRRIAKELQAEGSLQDSTSAAPQAGVGKQGGGISIELLLSIFSIVLAIAMYQWAKEDSEEMEARLRADSRALSTQVEALAKQSEASERRIAERIEKLTTAFEGAMQKISSAPATEVKFMTRSRGASIGAKKGGGARVGEALPGQVVTLISEEGKWIEIAYFDYATGKQSGGWGLKKYFARVQSTE